MLDDYASTDLSTQLLHDTQERIPTQFQARRLASHFVQARSYFDAARDATESVRPLILYYGVLTLSRAFCLIATGNAAPQHGLITKDWHAVFKDGNVDPSGASVEVVGGTFANLTAVASKTHMRIRFGSGPEMMTFDPTPPSNGTLLKLDELLARSPEVVPEYAAANEGRGSCYQARIDFPPQIFDNAKPMKASLLISAGAWLTFGKTGGDWREITKDRMAELGITRFEAVGAHSAEEFPHKQAMYARFTGTQAEFNDAVPYAESTVDGTGFLAKPLFPATWIPPIPRLFAISFILGMLARYHPEVWVPLGRGARGDRPYPIIRRMLDVIQEEYPIRIGQLIMPHA